MVVSQVRYAFERAGYTLEAILNHALLRQRQQRPESGTLGDCRNCRGHCFWLLRVHRVEEDSSGLVVGNAVHHVGVWGRLLDLQLLWLEVAAVWVAFLGSA